MNAEQTKSLAETNNWSHVDRQKVHADWDVLYQELAPLIQDAPPAAPQIQHVIARHYALVSRFYIPSKLAYIGMALFYQDDQGMRDFHNAYHPNMAGFLGQAIPIYAQRHL